MLGKKRNRCKKKKKNLVRRKGKSLTELKQEKTKEKQAISLVSKTRGSSPFFVFFFVVLVDVLVQNTLKRFLGEREVMLLFLGSAFCFWIIFVAHKLKAKGIKKRLFLFVVRFFHIRLCFC